MRAGALIEYRLRLHGVPVSWLTRIEEWDPDPARPRFVDMQLKGPYALWHHTHEFEPDGTGGTLMRDTVRYALPFGPLGEIARRLFVARDLEAIFDFRTQQVARELT
jgi:ligand-binding SRPBCC domain-containing protein